MRDIWTKIASHSHKDTIEPMRTRCILVPHVIFVRSSLLLQHHLITLWVWLSFFIILYRGIWHKKIPCISLWQITLGLCFSPISSERAVKVKTCQCKLYFSLPLSNIIIIHLSFRISKKERLQSATNLKSLD